MGPTEPMNNLSFNSNSDMMTLSVPKLRDDESNWPDYQSRIKRVMGSKGLWRHMLGSAVVLQPYMLLEGIPVLADKKMEAMDEQIEAREIKIIDFEKKEYYSAYYPLDDFDTSWEQDKGVENFKGDVGGGGSRCDNKEHAIPIGC